MHPRMRRGQSGRNQREFYGARRVCEAREPIVQVASEHSGTCRPGWAQDPRRGKQRGSEGPSWALPSPSRSEMPLDADYRGRMRCCMDAHLVPRRLQVVEGRARAQVGRGHLGGVREGATIRERAHWDGVGEHSCIWELLRIVSHVFKERILPCRRASRAVRLTHMAAIDSILSVLRGGFRKERGLGVRASPKLDLVRKSPGRCMQMFI